MDLQSAFRPETQRVKTTKALPAKSGLRNTSAVLNDTAATTNSMIPPDINYGISDDFEVITSDVDEDVVNAINDFDYNFDEDTYGDDDAFTHEVVDTSVPGNLVLEEMIVREDEMDSR